ncbi:hypothetical protein C3492_32205 [Streptomyces sp. Ru62]|uniref:hypothetical protein n=1 Tax=Streptomyces sp. Ru62 TaxID=2080745 RepID=UPI000CDDE256|nr:hypothetical protein [Streptomyces sp. Ru62]POX59471.1 hypothetical protein C3492_32205 [Streptomyces sp. Ru62]
MHEQTCAGMPEDSGESAPAQAGTPGAARERAESLTGRGRLDRALPWWEKAAEEGDAQAPVPPPSSTGSAGTSRRPSGGTAPAADRDGGGAPVVAAVLGECPGRLDGNRVAGGLARRGGDLEAAGRHFTQIADRDDDGSTAIAPHEIRQAFQRVCLQH